MDEVKRPDPGAEPAAAPGEVDELVARSVEAFERGGETAVEALLSDAPAAVATAARTRLATLRRMGLLADAPSATGAPVPVQIGPFEIRERLGAGGMGEVFLGVQREPIARRVAIKLIRVGMHSDEVRARFAAEREALSLMAHPNIAAVLDAGTTADGRPFFAMEHVPGLALMAYCDQRQLDPRARLELFVTICDAVQHAHHKGVIHRDLKPSNILVMEVDGRPVPKVIDFGVAKTVAHALAAAPTFTRLGEMIGTPEYMSPEQAARGELDIDTRADVYSLGVILYQLLTGTLPFDAQRLRAAGYHDMVGILRSEEPPRPSTRVTPRGGRRAQGALAAEQRSLYRRLRSDLDWVVLQALAKDRNQRYATVSELRADVARAMRNEPVSARAPSLSYRVQKFVRRYRVQVAAALLACLGLTVSLWLSLRAWDVAVRSQRSAAQARADADRARADAQVELGRAIAVIDDMVQRVSGISLAHAPQAEPERWNMLRGALACYRKLIADGAQDPGLAESLAPALAGAERVQALLEAAGVKR